MVPGTISEKTPASRTRRAISCVYCEPKSRIRTRSRGLRGTAGSRLLVAVGSSSVVVIRASSRAWVSVAEHSPVREHHGHLMGIAGGDHLGITHRATGLHHRGDSR